MSPRLTLEQRLGNVLEANCVKRRRLAHCLGICRFRAGTTCLCLCRGNNTHRELFAGAAEEHEAG